MTSIEIVVAIVGIAVTVLATYFVARWQLKRSENVEEVRRKEEEAKEEARRREEEAKKEKRIVTDFLLFLESRRLLREGANYGDYSSPEQLHDAVAEIYRRLTEFRAQLWDILDSRGVLDTVAPIPDVWPKVRSMQGRCKNVLMEVEAAIPPNNERRRDEALPHGFHPSSDVKEEYYRQPQAEACFVEFQKASDSARRALCGEYDLCHSPFCKRFC